MQVWNTLVNHKILCSRFLFVYLGLLPFVFFLFLTFLFFFKGVNCSKMYSTYKPKVNSTMEQVRIPLQQSTVYFLFKPCINSYHNTNTTDYTTS